MSKNGKRLVQGVRELLRTEGTTLEDLHMVATDVVVTLDKLASKTVRKLKVGQKIRCYNEESNKELGQKGADLVCFFQETYDTKTRGPTIRVYENGKEWSTSLDCLLEVYEDFDPESEEGKKLQQSKPKKRGRKPKKAAAELDRFDDPEWGPSPVYEEETDGEEYDFNNLPDDYEEYAEYD